MITENVKKLLSEIPDYNPFGEKITVVAAAKTRSAEEINDAIKAGLTDVGENKAQEFRDKYPRLLPCNYHFFGRLQKNKVKYLIGKACLIQSVDSVDLAQEISRQSEAKGITTDILVEVNQGEEQKGGFPFEKVLSAVDKISALPFARVRGLMTVLPKNADNLTEMCLQTRKLYDIIRSSFDVSVLSMGMTDDYKIAIENGSNMIRLGRAVFGERRYEEK